MRTVMTAALTLIVGALLSVLSPPAASAAGPVPAPAGLTATEVSFQGFGGLTLRGTVLAPQKARGPLPGVVLVTGSGSGVPREYLLTEATEFARRGLAVLIYDKRSAGYTQFRRSYSELADDALGAVRELRAQPGVDPAKVGLWGLSEGGWVAPLAASRSADAAFVIVVGGNAMTPIRQQVWNESSGLRRAGVSGSLIDRGKRNFARLGADADLFAEAFHDAPGVLERVRQPVLGIWGGRDLQTPPEDNPPLFARALRRGGNTHYTFRFFPEADHGVHETPDRGLTRGDALAPGYADLVGSWVRDVTSGRLPDADTAPLPEQDYPSVAIAPSPWWASVWMQTAALALFVVAFAGYPLAALARRLRGRTVRPVSRWAGLLAGAGLTAAAGLVFYIFYLMAAGRYPDPGPVLAGRPLPWLALQGLAAAAVCAGAATAVSWRRAAGSVPVAERVRLGLLLTAGAVFVPWAVYWGLLVP
ncbi:alpha/beta hydrolase family protein [Actinomadura livida]|uniref:Dienelactone hydrolase n=2 Tax=Actinomadura livida TaxID=79909 RepID=A0A7W7IDM5_9ACTN|nr:MULTISPECIES: prolyl oligopeptidase family serine peptidase [Actinomadura]MBB4775183.1 dienelactone hydrolase [Actinomadura catellatispora]